MAVEIKPHNSISGYLTSDLPRNYWNVFVLTLQKGDLQSRFKDTLV